MIIHTLCIQTLLIIQTITIFFVQTFIIVHTFTTAFYSNIYNYSYIYYHNNVYYSNYYYRISSNKINYKYYHNIIIYANSLNNGDIMAKYKQISTPPELHARIAEHGLANESMYNVLERLLTVYEMNTQPKPLKGYTLKARDIYPTPEMARGALNSQEAFEDPEFFEVVEVRE